MISHVPPPLAIYFIQIGSSGPIKIGHSLQPEQRMRQLQTAHPVTLRLLGVMRGTKERERILHTHFDWLRLRGEWFRPDEYLTWWIGRAVEVDRQWYEQGWHHVYADAIEASKRGELWT